MLMPFAMALLAASAAGVESARIPLEAVKKMNARVVGRGGKGRDGDDSSRRASLSRGVSGIDSLVNFTSEFTAPGFDSAGNPQSVWPYSMVGRAPEGNDSTEIRAPIIPVVLDLLDPSGHVAVFQGHPLTFDPARFVKPLVRSPLFQPFQYFSGFTQFGDAMMRAQFWDVIRHRGRHGDDDNDRDGGDDDGYHVLLKPSVRRARHMQIPFGFYYFFTDANDVPRGALVEGGVFTSLLFPATAPVDDTTPIGAAELSHDMTTRDITTLLFDNVFLYDGNLNDCCVLGFHSYDFEPGDAQNGNRERRFVMNYSSWIGNAVIGGGFEDITAISHEIAEILADPFVDNATPWWLSVDLFSASGLCQNNLETGDVTEVLSSNAVFPIQMNGRTYHPQNEALLPWFAFQSPSNAIKGSYSFPDETTLTSLSPGPLLPGCVPAP